MNVAAGDTDIASLTFRDSTFWWKYRDSWSLLTSENILPIYGPIYYSSILLKVDDCKVEVGVSRRHDELKPSSIYKTYSLSTQVRYIGNKQNTFYWCSKHISEVNDSKVNCFIWIHCSIPLIHLFARGSFCMTNRSISRIGSKSTT